MNTTKNQPSWEDLRLFLSVAETGSFSAAARQLALGQATLSRRIAELETKLEEPLFIRAKQGCTLTKLGNTLLPAAKQMANWAEEASTVIDQNPKSIHGKVRITAPPGIAFCLLPRISQKLIENYPDIEMEVLSGIEKLDLARGEADLALRTQKPTSSELLCLAEVSSKIQIYAHPNYLKKIKEKPEIADLDWICWTPELDHLKVNQILNQQIKNFKPVFSSNDYNVQMSACAAGVGVMVLPTALKEHPLLNILVAVDIDMSQYDGDRLYLVAHKRQAYLPKVKQVVKATKLVFDEIISNLD